MPILNVKISQPATAEMTQQVANSLSDLTTCILRKAREAAVIPLE